MLVVVFDGLNYRFRCSDMLHNRTHKGSRRPCNILTPWHPQRSLTGWTLYSKDMYNSGEKLSPKSVLNELKSIPTHEETYPCNISLRYVPSTFIFAWKHYDYVPATRPC